VFQDEASGTGAAFSGDVARITFGKEQYAWHPARKEGYADPDGPAAQSTVKGSASAEYDLPPASLTILRGKIAATAAN
jgi:hypothetical protein